MFRDSNWQKKVGLRDRKAHKECWNRPVHPKAESTSLRVCPHGVIYELNCDKNKWIPVPPWAIRGGIYDW